MSIEGPSRLVRRALEIWNIHYNYHRPHSAAAGQPPLSRFKAGVTNFLPPTTTAA